MKPYLPLAAELSVENGLLMRGNHIVILPQLREEDILNKIHVGHQGISKCRDNRQDSLCGGLDYLPSWRDYSQKLQDRLYPPTTESRTIDPVRTTRPTVAKGWDRPV